jgi:hypothetical protein
LCVYPVTAEMRATTKAPPRWVSYSSSMGFTCQSIGTQGEGQKAANTQHNQEAAPQEEEQ